MQAKQNDLVAMNKARIKRWQWLSSISEEQFKEYINVVRDIPQRQQAEKLGHLWYAAWQDGRNTKRLFRRFQKALKEYAKAIGNKDIT